MPTQKNPREARALYRERESESRAAINAHAKRWQMPAAEKGTQWPSKLITDEFNYSTPITTLPANGTATVYITILKMEEDTGGGGFIPGFGAAVVLIFLALTGALFSQIQKRKNLYKKKGWIC